jgi:nuclear pore complex protein Nup85
MNELCTTLDNLWFPAHLLDLLHHADQLQDAINSDSNDFQAGESLREFLLLEYATCLMSNSSLWQVGVLYLDYCPVQGRHRLELLLERIPLTNEKRAEKANNNYYITFRLFSSQTF